MKRGRKRLKVFFGPSPPDWLVQVVPGPQVFLDARLTACGLGAAAASANGLFYLFFLPFLDLQIVF